MAAHPERLEPGSPIDAKADEHAELESKHSSGRHGAESIQFGIQLFRRWRAARRSWEIVGKHRKRKAQEPGSLQAV